MRNENPAATERMESGHLTNPSVSTDNKMNAQQARKPRCTPTLTKVYVGLLSSGSLVYGVMTLTKVIKIR